MHTQIYFSVCTCIIEQLAIVFVDKMRLYKEAYWYNVNIIFTLAISIKINALHILHRN